MASKKSSQYGSTGRRSNSGSSSNKSATRATTSRDGRGGSDAGGTSRRDEEGQPTTARGGSRTSTSTSTSTNRGSNRSGSRGGSQGERGSRGQFEGGGRSPYGNVSAQGGYGYGMPMGMGPFGASPSGYFGSPSGFVGSPSGFVGSPSGFIGSPSGYVGQGYVGGSPNNAPGLGWHGSQDHGANMGGQHAGRGPRNYRRSDERIEDEINERLMRNGALDATNIDVTVEDGIVTLSGEVESRQAKRLAEQIIEDSYGVEDVRNELAVSSSGRVASDEDDDASEGENEYEEESTGKRSRTRRSST